MMEAKLNLLKLKEGITSKMIDPNDIEKKYKIPIDKREKIREFSVQWENYLDPLKKI